MSSASRSLLGWAGRTVCCDVPVVGEVVDEALDEGFVADGFVDGFADCGERGVVVGDSLG